MLDRCLAQQMDRRESKAMLRFATFSKASLPYANFKEQAPSKLPADKETLLVFYCGGDT